MSVNACVLCGKEFEAAKPSVKTCGVVCRNRLIARERQERSIQHKACAVCGTQFSVGASEWDRETCSKQCAYKLRGMKTTRSVDRVCEKCGKPFRAKASQVEAHGGKYCSVKCLHERNIAATTRSCVVCGEQFSSPPSQMHVKTCSTDCGYKMMTGIGNPRYRGVTYTTVIDGKKVVRRTSWASAEHCAGRTRALKGASANSDKAKVQAFYELAKEMTEKTGVRHHVDHIVPLKSRIVCGLHNEFNLQVITAEENIRKHNRSWPEMP